MSCNTDCQNRVSLCKGEKDRDEENERDRQPDKRKTEKETKLHKL